MLLVSPHAIDKAVASGFYGSRVVVLPCGCYMQDFIGTIVIYRIHFTDVVVKILWILDFSNFRV